MRTGWGDARRDDAVLAAWFLGTRALLLVALAVVARRHGDSLGDLLSVFDGGYYREIATRGYPAVLPAGPHGVGRSPVAFFPLFPLLLRPLTAAGLPVVAAATVVNLAAGLVATLLVRRVVGRYADRRVAVAVAMLWSVQPLGFVLSLVYSEAVYAALAAGCLLLLLERRWLAAGALAALGSAARPSGLVLAACVVAAALPWRRLASAERWRAVAATALAGAGFAAYMAYLWLRYDRADAWFATEREGWQVYTDGGGETARRFGRYLTHPAQRPAATVVALFLIAAVALAVLMLRDRAPLPVAAFALLTLLLAVTTRNAYSSIPRFVLPASFPLVVPLAVRLCRARRGGALVGAASAAAAVVMTGAGVYATSVSTFPP